MTQTREDRRRLVASLGVSTALQFPLAALFFAATMLWSVAVLEEQSLGPSALDRAGITVLVLEHRFKAAIAPLHRPLTVRAPRQREAAAPHAAVANRAAPVVNHRAPFFTRRAERWDVPAPRPIAAPAQRPAAAHVANEPVAAAAAQPAPPTSAPLATEAVVSVNAPAQSAPVRGSEGPNGGWGQNFEKPMLADETAIADLRAKYHLAGSISIRVDENGKPLKFVFPDSLGGDARTEIERRLTALRYIPAECNGLRCAGTMQLTM